jgi:hypothetical protein
VLPASAIYAMDMFLVKPRLVEDGSAENPAIEVGFLVVFASALGVMLFVTTACWLNDALAEVVGADDDKAKFVPAPVVTVLYIWNTVFVVEAVGNVISMFLVRVEPIATVFMIAPPPSGVDQLPVEVEPFRFDAARV